MPRNVRRLDVLDALPDIAEVGVGKLLLQKAGMGRSNHVESADAIVLGKQHPDEVGPSETRCSGNENSPINGHPGPLLSREGRPAVKGRARLQRTRTPRPAWLPDPRRSCRRI